MKTLLTILLIFILSGCDEPVSITYRVGQKFNYDSLKKANPKISLSLVYQEQEFSKYFIRGYATGNIWITVNNDSTITSYFKY